MPASTETPSKTKKPAKLFSVTGDASGIHASLSGYSEDRLANAVEVLKGLSQAGAQFPKASRLAYELDAFVNEPTAKDESKTATTKTP
jgi:hypothetical protein